MIRDGKARFRRLHYGQGFIAMIGTHLRWMLQGPFDAAASDDAWQDHDRESSNQTHGAE
jgi:hypothetical protein